MKSNQGIFRILQAIKRLLDLSISTPSLIFQFPIFQIIYVVIRLDSSRWFIFAHPHIGEIKQLFDVHRFTQITGDMTNLTNLLKIKQEEWSG